VHLLVSEQHIDSVTHGATIKDLKKVYTKYYWAVHTRQMF